MFSTVLKEITDYLDKRFIMNIFFPSLVFWGLVVALVVVSGNTAQTLETWGKQKTEVQALLIIGFLAWVTFFAQLLANGLTALTQLYEGNWKWIPYVGQKAETARQKYHSRVMESLYDNLKYLGNEEQAKTIEADVASIKSEVLQLKDSGKDKDRKTIEAELASIKSERLQHYEQLFFYYPPPTRPETVRPTRLGNIIKSAELYPLLRYDMDAVLLWPRLYPVLPESFRDLLADAKSSLDMMLIVSFLGVCLAVLGGGYLLLAKAASTLFLRTFCGGLLVGWLAYQGALGAGLSYAHFIRSAFDLYRGSLLKELGLEPPTALDRERNFWSNVCKYLYRGFLEQPEAFKYADPATSPKERGA
jgi:hypothetical protein